MNRFTRPLGERPYKRIFILATEGEKTEPQYFEGIFGNNELVLKVTCLETKRGLSAPRHVLDRLDAYIKKAELRKSDQAWLVVDRDHWKASHISELFQWCNEENARKPEIVHNMALSVPCFELWLLWHFEEAEVIRTSEELKEALKRHLPEYDKKLSTSDLRKLASQIVRAKKFAVKARGDSPLFSPEKWGSNVDILVTELQTAK